MLADIEAGKIDCVIVYKVDRLSRSLLDFTKIVETFDQHGVSFVSVTQQFNTSTSMGRLVLNVLLSFAQFEREMISERIRDKIAASRRKGKWSGGMPLLGYTVENTKLIVDEAEADRVRQIFELYLEHRSLLPVVKELEATRLDDQTMGDQERRPPRRPSIHQERGLQTADQRHLHRQDSIQGRNPRRRARWRSCRWTFSASPNATQRQRPIRRHGCSQQAQRIAERPDLVPSLRSTDDTLVQLQRQQAISLLRLRHRDAEGLGRNAPSPSVPAGEIERFVVEQIQSIGTDEDLLNQTIGQIESRSEQLTETWRPNANR